MTDMLTGVCLGFKDRGLLDIYRREQAEFYSKALPILTTLFLALTAGLEVRYRWM